MTDTPTSGRRVTPVETPLATAGRDTTKRQWVLLVCTWIGLAALLTVIQRGRLTPTVFADELTYGRLAQNIGQGLGATFQGLPATQHSLYPYLVAPAWALFHGETAYRVALAINALTMSSVVLPAFAIARTVAGFRLALASAALAALVPSMVWAGMLMSESLAYPASAWCLLAILMALRRPGLQTALLAGAAVIAGYLARSQFIALGGVLVLAVALEILRHGRAGIPARARRFRWILIGAGLAAVAAIAIVFFKQSAVGGYACVLKNPPRPNELAPPAFHYLGTAAIAFGLLPAIGLIALAISRHAWRDDRSGPLLAVAVSATLVLIFSAAWTAVTTSPELQERYVFYAAPVVLPVLLLVPGRVQPRMLALVTVAAVLYCAFAFPGFQNVTGKVIVDRTGLTGPLADVLSDQHVIWATASAFLGAGLWLALAKRPRRAVAAALALTAVFAVPVLFARQVDANEMSSAQAQRYQRPLSTVDEIANGRRAAVVITRGAPLFAGFQLQLWNQSIDRVFRVGTTDETGVGQACPVIVSRGSGDMRPKQLCAGEGLPQVLVLIDGAGTRLRPANGTVQYIGAGIRVWQVPGGEAPRLKLDPVSAGTLELPEGGPPPQPTGRCNGTS